MTCGASAGRRANLGACRRPRRRLMLRGLATPSLPGGFETKSPGQFQATLGPTTNHANGGSTPPFHNGPVTLPRSPSESSPTLTLRHVAAVFLGVNLSTTLATQRIDQAAALGDILCKCESRLSSLLNAHGLALSVFKRAISFGFNLHRPG